ncbi:hypothetical protein Tco_0695026, partial [Tanacetum coccineum]
MDSSLIQENVQDLHLIPHQPVIEEDQLDLKVIPIEDHSVSSDTLERLNFYKAVQYNEETKLISLTTKNCSFEIEFGVAAFRSICGFNYLEKGLEYDNETSFEEIQATILNVGYRKVGKPSQPLETTLLKTGFSPTWRLLMAYISNSLGGNTGSKDQLNYMHQLIAHGLINGLKLDYGGIIFNDLAAKLNNSVRHPSPAYARFISLILEKALGDNYVISEEIALKIPLMGNSIFNLEPTSSEVPITCHVDRVCKSVSEACLVYEDVVDLDLSDNVYDGSPSEDPKFNEIIQNVKTKTMSSLLDPNSIATTDVYQYKVVTNVLNEDVIGESAIPSGSCDHNLKDDCYGRANEISNCLNEEVIDQSSIYSGSGDQNIKDDCLDKTIKISNCLSEEVVYQSAIPSGSDDHNLKVDCHVNSNEVSNMQNHVESDNQLQSESNVYAFMLSKQVSPGQSIENLIHRGDDIMNVDCDDESENKGNHCTFEDVVHAYLNLSEFNGLTEQVRLLTNQVTSLVNEHIKEHISSIQIPSFPSKESLVAEFVKCIEANNSSLSKDVTELSAKQKELVDEKGLEYDNEPSFAEIQATILNVGYTKVGSCDHNLKDDCYGKANEISNCLNEEVIDQSSIYSGSGDQNLKDDCPGKTIEISNCLSEEVVYQSAIPSGSGDQNLKDNCPGKTIDISNCLSEAVIDQSAIPSGSGDHNLKDDCFGKVNEVSNCLNQEVIVETIIPTCHFTLKFLYICFQVFIFLGSDDHNLKVDCNVNSNEVSNIQNHGESDNQLQSESNVYAFMLSKQVSLGQSIENLIHGGDDIMNVDCDDESENEGTHRAFEDVVQAYPNLSEFNGLTEQVRLLTNQVTSLGVTPSFSSVSVEINGLTSVQKNLKDEINELKKSSSSKSSIDQVTRDVISAIQPELKSIKEHISSIQIPSFPSKESLVVEFVKCIEASNSSLSKDVTELSAKQKELVDEVNKLGNSSLSNPSIDDISKAVVGLIKPELESFIKSVTDLFLKTKVNINVPEDILRVGESMKNLSNSISSILSTVNTITQRPVQLSPEFATLPEEIQRFRSSVNDIVTFKVEISNLAKNNHENVSMFKELSVYFSNLQKAVNDFENRLVESVPSKKERLADQQLMEVISINQALIKANISKISDSMLVLVKWAKSIFVDGSASASKTTPGCEKSSFKLPVFNRDVTELSLVAESNVRPLSNNQETTSSVLSEKDVPKGDPQGQTSLHVEVEAIHSTSVETDSHQNVGPDLSITNFESCENVTVSPTPSVVSEKYVVQGDPQGQTSSHVEVEALHSSSVETDGHQNVYPESSNKNVESCENVTVSSTPSDKQVGTFEYEVGGVKYLMTPEEIAKQKDDEEIIKRKNQEEKASYAKIVNVLAEDERNLHIHRVSAIRDEEDHNLEVKYKNRKILYDKYVRALNPQCKNDLEKMTAVDIISRKCPICVTIYRASLMVIKAHAPLNLSDFNYFEWLKIQKCASRKKSKQA